MNPKTVDTERQVSWAAFRTEMRLISPILYVWFAIWVILLICLAESGGRILVLSVFTWSMTGLAMVSLWCALYCPRTAIRDGVGLLVVMFASVGSFWLLGWFSQRRDLLYQNAETVLAIFLVTAFAFLPCWFMRRFLGWQIAHFAGVRFEDDRRIRIRELFVWTAVAAAFVAFLPWLLGLISPEGYESIAETTAFLLVSAVGLPSLAAVLFFTMLGTLGVRTTAFLLPIGGTFLALLYAIVMSLFNGDPLRATLFEVGWDAAYCWSLSGYVFLAASFYLQSWGIYFKVGFCNHRRRFQITLEEYELSLQEAAAAREAAYRIDVQHEETA